MSQRKRMRSEYIFYRNRTRQTNERTNDGQVYRRWSSMCIHFFNLNQSAETYAIEKSMIFIVMQHNYENNNRRGWSKCNLLFYSFFLFFFYNIDDVDDNIQTNLLLLNDNRSISSIFWFLLRESICFQLWCCIRLVLFCFVFFCPSWMIV